LFVVVATVGGRLLPSAFRYSDRLANVAAQKHARIDTMRTLISDARRLSVIFPGAMRWAQKLDSSLTRPVTQSVAEARLIALTSSLAREAGVSTSTVQVVTSPVGAPQQRNVFGPSREQILVRLTGQASTEALTTFFRAIETASDILSVRSIDVTAGGGAGPAGLQSRRLSLDVQIATLAMLNRAQVSPEDSRE
jgi:hypothetical protein